MQLIARIDRTSYIPLYAQVREALRETIEHGSAQPDDQLPSEPDLCRLFDVSRTVIRQALNGLEYEGLVVRKKGKGTFVAKPKIGESLFQELTGFYQDMERKGQQPVSRVLKQQIVACSAKVAAYLGLETSAPVLQIDRVRYVNDEPIVFVTTFLPARLCPGLVEIDLTHRSLYACLESEYGIVIARGRRVIKAVVASEYEARLLEIAEGAPLISLDSVSYLEEGTAIEYYHALHRGDRSMFEVDLVRTREGAAILT